MANFEDKQYLPDEKESFESGKDFLFCIFDITGTDLYAIGGQTGGSLNKTQNIGEISSKDSKDDWVRRVPGKKAYSVGISGNCKRDDAAHMQLEEALEQNRPVCWKKINKITGEALQGGLAYISEYSREDPEDGPSTYSLSLDGSGPAVDLRGLDVNQLPNGLTIPVQDLRAEEGTEAGTIALSWGAVKNATALKVMVKGAEDYVFKPAVTTPAAITKTATGCVVKDLKPGVGYRLKLEVEGGLNEGTSNLVVFAAKA